MRVLASTILATLLAGCGMYPTNPLNTAASRGDTDQIRHLANAANINAPGPFGITPLVSAARAGALHAIPVLVQLGADPNLRAGVNYWTPLMHAIHKNQPGSVRVLLDSGANINGRSGNGENALMMAAGYGYTDIVRLLLDRGADARVSAGGGWTALDFAVSGVTDIDKFTAGDCQWPTVQLLMARVPGLKLGSSGLERHLEVVKAKGCAGANQVAERLTR